MKEDYKYLFSFNFGKRCYVLLSNNDKVKYFEKVNGEYVMPIISFRLLDNEGKSLTHVNQHFFMNELTNRLNDAFRKKIFVNDSECINYLNDLNSKINNDLSLKELFKGSNMKQIDEYYFELNKEQIVKYLDQFRFDTFVDYNNVSIFSGDIEKNSNNGDSNVLELESIFKNNDIQKKDITDSEVISSDVYFNSINNSLNVNNTILSQNVIDNNSFNTFENSVSEVVNTNDDDFLDMVDDNEVINVTNDISEDTMNVTIENVFNPFDDFVNEENNNVDVSKNENVSVYDNIDNNIDNLFENNSDNLNIVDDKSFNSNSDTNNDMVDVNKDNNENIFNVNSEDISFKVDNQVSNLSYIDQVKSRIENNNPQFGAISNNNLNSLNNINFGNEMGSDSTVLSSEIINDRSVNDLPELDKIDIDDVVSSSENKKGKKKKGGLLLFILIIFILVVAGILIYNFVL